MQKPCQWTVRDADGGGRFRRLTITQLVSRGVSIAVHVPRRQWPNANRPGFRRPLAISLDSVTVPAVRFLGAQAVAAWVLLSFHVVYVHRSCIQ